MKYIGGYLFGILLQAFISLSIFQDLLNSLKNQQYGDLVLVYPIRTDRHGKHLNHFESYNNYPDEAYFNINLFHKNITLELKKHRNLLANDARFVVHDTKDTVSSIHGGKQTNSLYEGKVKSDEDSHVTLTTCEGLNGIIKTDNKEYFIESVSQHLEKRDISPFVPIPHIIYKTSKHNDEHCSHNQSPFKFQRSLYITPSSTRNRRDEDEPHQFKKLTIETAIFVDNLMYKFMAAKYPLNTDDQLLTHILTFFGGIEIMYNLPSLGQVPVNFVITQIEVFKTNNLPFSTSDFGNELLVPFCDYQYEINIKDDNNATHWDHAVLMTGIDIKYDDGRTNLIGMAPISGFCYENQSCSIVEGTNFYGVYILAHEFGHNLGMEHDGEGNTCNGDKYFMSPYTKPDQKEWSNCSKNYLAEYLKEEETACLLDERETRSEFDFMEKLPGQRYSKEEQCELDFGRNAIVDPKQPLEEICNVLNCLLGIFPKNFHSALEGTYCGPGKWCRDKKCVAFGSKDIIAINGGWGPWSELSNCTSGCVKGGNGIKVSQRYCDNPRPQNGGKPCSGEKYRFELCSDYYLCKKKQKTTIKLFERSICPQKPSYFEETVTGEGLQNFNDQSYGCIVWCETTLYDDYISWDVFYPDGTSCAFVNPSQRSYCYQGKCIDFKCKENPTKCQASADSLYG